MISCLQISSDTNIDLVKEGHKSIEQRNLQDASAQCFNVNIKTWSKTKDDPGTFFIAGYGDVPPECLDNDAECAFQICGRITLDIIVTSGYWKFSITGDIHQLVYHIEHPTSGKQNLGEFPTKMGGSWDVFQSYLRRSAEAWMYTDSFSCSSVCMVSGIVIRYILLPHQERMKKSTLQMLLYCPYHPHNRSFVFHQFRRKDSFSQISTLPQTEKGGKKITENIGKIVKNG